MSGDLEHRFDPSRSFAEKLDAEDRLARCRDLFHLPESRFGRERLYFVGNSLGLQPKDTRSAVEEEVEAWARFAVDAHFEGTHPWFAYHETCRDTSARLVGATPGEVVMMNSLTTNLHLMLASFYHPRGARRKILVDPFSFPSDTYALKSWIAQRGGVPDELLLTIEPANGSFVVSTDEIVETIRKTGDELSLVMMSGVNYFTGQCFDLEAITTAAHRQGAQAGFDLAHAAGNVQLSLHDWNVDFAVWCTYKYLNSGPGAVAGCFVHERFARKPELPRLAGWWGHDPDTRFQMHLQPDFSPQPGAAGWQVSNPPVLALAPVRVSLQIFDDVGMPALRQKSIALTGYLDRLLREAQIGGLEILTPADAESRGCQLSLRFEQAAKTIFDRLQRMDVVADLRAPDVIRVAPVPLYNRYVDVWDFVQRLCECVGT